ncbi:MAG TPA: 50S ribosomal protein L25 [bacterium]|nr:50S ribosomal protein L25 [bacterium]
MADYTLHAAERDTSCKPHQLLQQGILPATVYGHAFPSQSLQLVEADFLPVFTKAGQTTLVDLQIGKDKKYPVLIHQYQKDPLTGRIKHVEFYHVKLTEKLKADVPVELVGTAPALKLGGTLFHNLQEIEVECLPQDIPSVIEVDVSVLTEVEQGLTVKDLKLSDKVHVLTDGNELVVKILPITEEKEEEAVAAEGTQPEVIGEKKKEEEAAAKE